MRHCALELCGPAAPVAAWSWHASSLRLTTSLTETVLIVPPLAVIETSVDGEEVVIETVADEQHRDVEEDGHGPRLEQEVAGSLVGRYQSGERSRVRSQSITSPCDTLVERSFQWPCKTSVSSWAVCLHTDHPRSSHALPRVHVFAGSRRSVRGDCGHQSKPATIPNRWPQRGPTGARFPLKNKGVTLGGLLFPIEHHCCNPSCGWRIVVPPCPR